MSGVEAAGFVLAVLPLLISALEVPKGLRATERLVAVPDSV
jgi:hypothetical protein